MTNLCIDNKPITSGGIDIATVKRDRIARKRERERVQCCLCFENFDPRRIQRRLRDCATETKRIRSIEKKGETSASEKEKKDLKIAGSVH